MLWNVKLEDFDNSEVLHRPDDIDVCNVWVNERGIPQELATDILGRGSVYQQLGSSMCVPS